MANQKEWDKRFFGVADQVASWSSCLRRKVGAVIVKDKRILTTGYNGAPAGVTTCMERGVCIRQENNIPSGKNQEFCYAAHAEQNAIAQAALLGVSVKGATLYCTHQPCTICTRIIINAGIDRVVFENGYPDEFALQFFNESGVKIEKFEE